jgi:hypothetical protein
VACARYNLGRCFELGDGALQDLPLAVTLGLSCIVISEIEVPNLLANLV